MKIVNQSHFLHAFLKYSQNTLDSETVNCHMWSKRFKNVFTFIQNYQKQNLLDSCTSCVLSTHKIFCRIHCNQKQNIQY